MPKNKLIAIVGTNASGKSALGFELAKHFNAEIVSADSRQVYKYLDLGTGKVTQDEMREVRHHLINILELNEPFSLAQYQTLAYQAIDEITARGAIPFLVGGTGLYTRAVVNGYNLADVPPDEKLRAELAGKTDEEQKQILISMCDIDIPKNLGCRSLLRRIEKQRMGITAENENIPRYDVLQLGLTWDKEELHKRIEIRLDKRIQQGMIEEVEHVIKLGARAEFLEGLGLEYRLIYRYLMGQYESRQAFRDDLFKEIRHFAKRQMTWFRKEKNIIWLDSKGDYFTEAKKLIGDFLL
ncbi:tRNA dimethylallyltransferase 2 [Spirochaetia bacterium]|nr:tRNA dimethylallyltransferase 2 [Spirochaetia bacterium]